MQVMQKVAAQLSADTLKSGLTNADVVNLADEHLQTISTSGIPSAILELKAGMPVILLRNLSSERGLCNDIRLIIHQVR